MGREKIFNVDHADYMKKKEFFSPEIGTRSKLKEGIWLPTSVCAILLNCSVQTVREVYIAQRVRVMKFKDGPLLVNLKDLEKYRV